MATDLLEIYAFLLLLEDDHGGADDDDGGELDAIAASLMRAPSTNHGPPFNFLNMEDNVFQTHFRFRRVDWPLLMNKLDIPLTLLAHLSTDKSIEVNGQLALAILLKRFAYPCRYADLSLFFNMSVPCICEHFYAAFDFLYSLFVKHMLSTLNQPWATRRLESYAAAVQAKSKGAMSTVVAFIDGTFRRTCRPSSHQRQAYSGHKRAHGLKFQGLLTPDGLVWNLFGPVEALWSVVLLPIGKFDGTAKSRGLSPHRLRLRQNC
jgi:hypothetical protein